MYTVTDQFYTQDGEWFESNKPFSIDKKHIDRYSQEDIPQKGAATHLVAKVPAGLRVRIINRYNNEAVKDFVSDGKWFDFPMGKGAAYKPDQGETGPYNLVVDGQLVAEGIGLPNSWHVSTWLVIGEGESIPETPEEGTPEIPEQPETPEDKIWVEVMVGQKVYSGYIS